jgi:citronellyl-CoA dehydrogenase
MAQSAPTRPAMFTEEHDAFRAMVRDVVDKEINPYVDDWEKAGIFPAHEVMSKLGKLGLLGLEYDEAIGGAGADHSFSVVLGEELGRIDAAGVSMAITVQTDMATPSLAHFGSPELRERYLRPTVAGDLVCSIAVTEPDAGSDVAAIRTRAVRDGDHWVINGAKTYITNGTQADWLCLLARTSDKPGYSGMSQIVFPTDTAGFTVSKSLAKLGNKSSDTAELSFDDCRVPVSNTIGEIGRGFQQQMQQFQKERMIAVYVGTGQIAQAIERTIAYLRERHVFGIPLLEHQHVQMKMAELVADLDVLRQYNYTIAEGYLRGEDTSYGATVAKLTAGRLIRRVADTLLQFHGGVGYIEETWVSRFFRDTRLLSIGGGADEVMLRTIAKLSGWPTSP